MPGAPLSHTLVAVRVRRVLVCVHDVLERSVIKPVAVLGGGERQLQAGVAQVRLGGAGPGHAVGAEGSTIHAVRGGVEPGAFVQLHGHFGGDIGSVPVLVPDASGGQMPLRVLIGLVRNGSGARDVPGGLGP